MTQSFRMIFLPALAMTISLLLKAESSWPELRIDASLQAELEQLEKEFAGQVGIYARRLDSNHGAALHADTLFPTASLIKVPIAVGVFQKIEEGELSLEQNLTYDPALIGYPHAGNDVIQRLRTGSEVKLSHLVLLMLAASDNHASLWCQALAGGGGRINELMAANGFDRIHVNSRTEGRRENWREHGWGQTTPRQMAELLAAIRERRILGPAASDSLYRFLSGAIFHQEALGQIPPFVQTASKQGAVSHSRSEVVVVNAPSGPYVFCVVTKNQEDRSWEADNAGYLLIRDVSRLLWNHFEPASDWTPPQP